MAVKAVSRHQIKLFAITLVRLLGWAPVAQAWQEAEVPATGAGSKQTPDGELWRPFSQHHSCGHLPRCDSWQPSPRRGTQGHLCGRNESVPRYPCACASFKHSKSVSIVISSKSSSLRTQHSHTIRFSLCLTEAHFPNDKWQSRAGSVG